ncbi:hypothetical protein M885DRAFT_510948 [Pelagophyceae sp. CCMP2097]|nr:hypothetical protein M885DRAFT_510948 [Pelagophyceae sp. CCMP2097]
MAMKPGRAYTCKRSSLAGRVVWAVVEQKSRSELVDILAAEEQSPDSIRTRNALLNDVFIFVQGAATVEARRTDVEHLGRRFQPRAGERGGWPGGRLCCEDAFTGRDVDNGLFVLHVLTRAVADGAAGPLAPLKDAPALLVKRVMPRMVAAATYIDLCNAVKGDALPSLEDLKAASAGGASLYDTYLQVEDVQTAYLKDIAAVVGAAAGTVGELQRFSTAPAAPKAPVEAAVEAPRPPSSVSARCKAQWDEGNSAFKDGRLPAALMYYSAAIAANGGDDCTQSEATAMVDAIAGGPDDALMPPQPNFPPPSGKWPLGDRNDDEAGAAPSGGAQPDLATVFEVVVVQRPEDAAVGAILYSNRAAVHLALAREDAALDRSLRAAGGASDDAASVAAFRRGHALAALDDATAAISRDGASAKAHFRGAKAALLVAELAEAADSGDGAAASKQLRCDALVRALDSLAADLTKRRAWRVGCGAAGRQGSAPATDARALVAAACRLPAPDARDAVACRGATTELAERLGALVDASAGKRAARARRGPLARGRADVEATALSDAPPDAPRAALLAHQLGLHLLHWARAVPNPPRHALGQLLEKLDAQPSFLAAGADGGLRDHLSEILSGPPDRPDAPDRP